MRDRPSLLRKKRGKINVGTATSEEREELPLALAPLVTDEAGRALGQLHHSATWRVPMPMIKKSACRGRRRKMTSIGGESNTARNIPHSMKTFAGYHSLCLHSNLLYAHVEPPAREVHIREDSNAMHDIHEDVEPLPPSRLVGHSTPTRGDEGTTTRGELTNRRGSSPRSLMHTHARHGIREGGPSLPRYLSPSSLSAASLPLPIVFAPSQTSPSGDYESGGRRKARSDETPSNSAAEESTLSGGICCANNRDVARTKAADPIRGQKERRGEEGAVSRTKF